MTKLILRYGLYAAGISMVIGLANWFLVAPNLGYKMTEAVGYLSMVGSLLTIPLAIKYYKNEHHQIVFKDAFKIGIGITTIASTFMFINTVLLFVFVGADEFLEWAKKGMTSEEWAKMEEQMVDMPDFLMSSWFQGLVMFVTVFIIGLIISLISSFLMRTKETVVGG